MMEKPIHLLKRLEPSIRPEYAGSRVTPPKPPLEGQSFDRLLALVADGSIRSDRPVTLAFEPEDELSRDQLDRLASASDLAESAGAERALMLIDGRGIVLEVGPRRLVAELSGQRHDPVVSLDAAVLVTDEGSGDSMGTLKLPGNGLVPRSVAEQIERVYEQRRSGERQETIDQEASGRRQAG